MKDNGDLIQFLKQKDYVMINNSLGSGSFGKTVLLKDPFINELFVSKKYEPQYDEIKEKFYKNFLDEIKILYKLNHPNIVRIYNYYAYENIFTGYILMEYIEGENIGNYINEYEDFLGMVTLDEVFFQLIEAFCYIEKNGIIHRDIRESNILITKEGIVKIIDFGIGKLDEVNSNNTDSLVNDVNRRNTDTLPQEYYDGVYTSQTDMFYVAELFNRLLIEANYPEGQDFSYQDILNKMMNKNPQNRYSNFNEVKEAIGKKDFSTLIISKKDKNIYQLFTNSIYESLSVFLDEKKFNNDVHKFISKLEKAIRDNSFEDKIQRNADIIGCVVEGRYRFNNNVNMMLEDISNFIQWYKSTTEDSKKLILDNIIHKLSHINVEIDEEFPF